MDVLPTREAPSRGGYLWYVTNGELVVGPVSTNLLVRGVAAGKVPDDARVWREPWPFWRAISSVREVRAVRRAQERFGAAWTPSATWSPPPPTSALVGATQWIASGTDEQEVIGFTLAAAVRAMGATKGLAHRPERALGGFVVRSAIGEDVRDRLGERVSSLDGAMRVARMGATLLDPHTSFVGARSLARSPRARRRHDGGRRARAGLLRRAPRRGARARQRRSAVPAKRSGAAQVVRARRLALPRRALTVRQWVRRASGATSGPGTPGPRT